MLIQGIDVSHHNGDINWTKVKNSGIKFAMIRTGYGIASDTQIDKKFKQNIESAKTAGIDVGVYHYSYATSSSEAVKEAKFCLQIVADYELDYPVCYDIEDSSILKYNKQTKTDMCISFCDTIEMSGYYAMIYANPDWLNNHLYSDQLLNRYDLWLAQWETDKPSITCGIWQRSEKGKVDGINGYVDLDVAYKDYKSLIEKSGLNNKKVITQTTTNTTQLKDYIVKKGDTLWSISEKFYGSGTKYKKIKEINSLPSDTIYAGQLLKI